jgi:hypothetical protein
MLPTEDPTNRYVPYFSAAGYIVYCVCGLIGGGVFPANSFGQALSWQISAGGAIAANVLAGIWLARRGEDLSAAGFTILGIVQGVFFAAIVMEHIDLKVGAAAVLLMIPAQILITFCRLFPLWVKIAGGIVCVLFAISYLTIAAGAQATVGLWQAACFMAAQALSVVWGGYFLKAARQSERQLHQTHHASNRSF